MKYHNRKIKTHEGTFDSAKEYNRWVVLKLMERSGKVSGLRRQVSFEVVPAQKGERPVRYIADFVYDQDGQTVVEDVKGVRTGEYVIKRKLMLWVHGIRIKEI